MFRQLLLIGLSALLGGAATLLAVSENAVFPRAEAQLAAGQRTAGGLTDIPPLSELDAGFTAEERTNIAVYESTNRSVVNINTRSTRTDALFLFESSSEGTGSGFVYDTAGHIVTNFHVIEGAREIQVTLFDGTSHEAKLVGVDPSSDIAVLKIMAPAEALFPLPVGDSSRLRVGQKVYALGNPFGLERTFTTGVISSLNRTLPARNRRLIKSIIQIDAAINPGSSGGPLLNSSGRMIGMNTAIASNTGQNSGVGFAIPASVVQRFVPQLIESGQIVRPDAGIQQVYQTDDGLRLAKLTPGGPAEVAGLRGPQTQRRQRGPFVYHWVDRSSADLIVQVDDQPITTADEFLSAIENKSPGDRVVIHVVRNGQRLSVPLTLAKSDN